MSRLAFAFTAPALEWRLDPGVSPVVGERRDGRPLGALMVGIGAIWIALALRVLIEGSPDVVAALGEDGVYLCLTIGTGLVLWGCRVLVPLQTIRIDGQCVRVTNRRITGTSSWTEPLASYRGVVWRTEPVRRRDEWQAIQLIDLWHDDASKTVNLFSSASDVAVPDFWQAWAHALDLTAIRRPPADARLLPQTDGISWFAR